MMDFTTMHDKQFSFAIFGIKKQEVYSFLLEAETAFKELTEKCAKLEKNNEEVTKLHQDKQLLCYNLEKEIDELKAELKEARETIAQLKGSKVKYAEAPKNEPFEEEEEEVTEEVAEEVTEEVTEEVAEDDEVPTIEIEATEETAEEAEEAEDAVEEVAEEAVEEKKPFSYEDDDDDDVFSGEVEDKVSNAFRIGNDDDPDDGFEFL